MSPFLGVIVHVQGATWGLGLAKSPLWTPVRGAIGEIHGNGPLTGSDQRRSQTNWRSLLQCTLSGPQTALNITPDF